MPFSTLGLSLPLLRAIEAQQYTQPTPIQAEAIPVILQGHDVLGIAQTGSGKTACFVLPILEKLKNTPPAKNRHIKSLVLAPTRELAIQIEEVFSAFSGFLPSPIKTMAVYGGVSINPQMIKMQGVEVLVATPGRLLDLIDSMAVHLSDVAILVIDEADKLLNLGFQEEVEDILALLPKKRQNLLFSATLGNDVANLMKGVLRNPIKVEVAPEQVVPDLIAQLAYLVTAERKGPLLRYLIKKGEWKQVLIFTASGRKADNLVEKLNKNGIQAMAMHGDKSQGARIDALNKFKSGKLQALVATDIAARGIDIQQLPYIVNYELPRSPKDYIHRIGRTGRAEANGQAISLIEPEEEHHFKVIQKKMGKQVETLESYAIDLAGF